jgi:hypothetical protein
MGVSVSGYSKATGMNYSDEYAAHYDTVDIIRSLDTQILSR